MAIRFTGTGAVQNSASTIITSSFTVGMWVKPGSTTVQKFWGVAGTAAGETLSLGLASSNGAFSITQGTCTVAAAVAAVQNDWHWVCGRWRPGTGTRIVSILFPNGSIDEITVVSGGSSLTTGTYMTLGAGISTDGATLVNPYTGSIGEFFCANGDIQFTPNNSLLTVQLRNTAKLGILSFPAVRNLVTEYRSLKFSGLSAADVLGEVYYGAGFGKQTWTANTADGVGDPHPPLLSQIYVKPDDFSQITLINSGG